MILLIVDTARIVVDEAHCVVQDQYRYEVLNILHYLTLLYPK